MSSSPGGDKQGGGRDVGHFGDAGKTGGVGGSTASKEASPSPPPAADSDVKKQKHQQEKLPVEQHQGGSATVGGGSFGANAIVDDDKAEKIPTATTTKATAAPLSWPLSSLAGGAEYVVQDVVAQQQQQQQQQHVHHYRNIVLPQQQPSAVAAAMAKGDAEDKGTKTASSAQEDKAAATTNDTATNVQNADGGMPMDSDVDAPTLPSVDSRKRKQQDSSEQRDVKRKIGGESSAESDNNGNGGNGAAAPPTNSGHAENSAHVKTNNGNSLTTEKSTTTSVGSTIVPTAVASPKTTSGNHPSGTPTTTPRDAKKNDDAIVVVSTQKPRLDAAADDSRKRPREDNIIVDAAGETTENNNITMEESSTSNEANNGANEKAIQPMDAGGARTTTPTTTTTAVPKSDGKTDENESTSPMDTSPREELQQVVSHSDEAHKMDAMVSVARNMNGEAALNSNGSSEDQLESVACNVLRQIASSSTTMDNTHSQSNAELRASPVVSQNGTGSMPTETAPLAIPADRNTMDYQFMKILAEYKEAQFSGTDPASLDTIDPVSLDSIIMENRSNHIGLLDDATTLQVRNHHQVHRWLLEQQSSLHKKLGYIGPKCTDAFQLFDLIPPSHAQELEQNLQSQQLLDPVGMTPIQQWLLHHGFSFQEPVKVLAAIRTPRRGTGFALEPNRHSTSLRAPKGGAGAVAERILSTIERNNSIKKARRGSFDSPPMNSRATTSCHVTPSRSPPTTQAPFFRERWNEIQKLDFPLRLSQESTSHGAFNEQANLPNIFRAIMLIFKQIQQYRNPSTGKMQDFILYSRDVHIALMKDALTYIYLRMAIGTGPIPETRLDTIPSADFVCAIQLLGLCGVPPAQLISFGLLTVQKAENESQKYLLTQGSLSGFLSRIEDTALAEMSKAAASSLAIIRRYLSLEKSRDETPCQGVYSPDSNASLGSQSVSSDQSMEEGRNRYQEMWDGIKKIDFPARDEHVVPVNEVENLPAIETALHLVMDMKTLYTDPKSGAAHLFQKSKKPNLRGNTLTYVYLRFAAGDGVLPNVAVDSIPAEDVTAFIALMEIFGISVTALEDAEVLSCRRPTQTLSKRRRSRSTSNSNWSINEQGSISRFKISLGSKPVKRLSSAHTIRRLLGLEDIPGWNMGPGSESVLEKLSASPTAPHSSKRVSHTASASTTTPTKGYPSSGLYRFVPANAKKDCWDLENGLSLVYPSREKPSKPPTARDADRFYCALCDLEFTYSRGNCHHEMSRHWETHSKPSKHAVTPVHHLMTPSPIDSSDKQIAPSATSKNTVPRQAIEARKVLADWCKAGRQSPLPTVSFPRRLLRKQSNVNSRPKYRRYFFNKVVQKKSDPNGYFFVLDVNTGHDEYDDAFDPDLILIPMNISGVLRGRLAGRPRYKCDLLDSTSNWIAGKTSEFEEVDAIAAMKTTYIWEEAWGIKCGKRQDVYKDTNRSQTPEAKHENQTEPESFAEEEQDIVRIAHVALPQPRLFIPDRTQNEYWDLENGLSLVRPPGIDNPTSKDATQFHCALCDNDFLFVQGNASNMRRHWEICQSRSNPSESVRSNLPSDSDDDSDAAQPSSADALDDDRKPLAANKRDTVPKSRRYVPPFVRKDYWGLENRISLVAPPHAKSVNGLSSKDAKQYYCAVCKEAYPHEFGGGHHYMERHWKMHAEGMPIVPPKAKKTMPETSSKTTKAAAKRDKYDDDDFDCAELDEAFDVDPSNFHFIPLNSRKTFWDFEKGLSLVYPFPSHDPPEPDAKHARRFHCAICQKEYRYTTEEGPGWMEAHWQKHTSGLLEKPAKSMKRLVPTAVLEDSGNHHFIPKDAEGKYWDLEKGLSLVYPSIKAPAGKEPSIRKVKSFYCALCQGEFPCDPAKGLTPRMAWHWQQHQYIKGGTII